jgi:hypothetical protein
MPHHPNHRPDQIDAVPWGNKGMHPPQFNNSVNTPLTGQRGKFLLFFPIGHAQA